MDSSPWGSSVHGDSPGKNSALGAMSSSRDSSQPRDRTHVSHIANGLFTREPQEYRSGYPILTPEHIPDPGVKTGSPALQMDSLPAELLRKPSKAIKLFLVLLHPKPCLQDRIQHWYLCIGSNQSILKEISPKYSFEGLMLKLKLQYFGQPDAKNWLTGKDSDAGKDWRQEKKGMTEGEMNGWHQTASPTWWRWVWASLGYWWWTRKPGMFMGTQRVKHDWVTGLTDPCIERVNFWYHFLCGLTLWSQMCRVISRSCES